jgi:hypothetical protein
VAGRRGAVSGLQLTQSVAQQLTYRGHFFPDSGADLKPLGVAGVNRQSGYVSKDFALEHIEVGQWIGPVLEQSNQQPGNEKLVSERCASQPAHVVDVDAKAFECVRIVSGRRSGRAGNSRLSSRSLQE